MKEKINNNNGIFINSLIPTPTGIKVAKELKEGDLLFDATGKPTKLVDIDINEKTPCYKVLLLDREIIVGEQQCFPVHSNIKKNKKIYVNYSAKFLYETNLQNKKKYNLYALLLNKNIDYIQKPRLPLNPYILGLFLGDGYNAGNYAVEFASPTVELPNKIAKILGVTAHRKTLKRVNYVFYTGEKRENGMNCCIQSKKLFKNVDGVRYLHDKKFIDEQYIYSSILERQQLLCGLFDTDGSVTKTGRLQFSTTSFQMAQQIQFLCFSLGYKCFFRTLPPRDLKRKTLYLLEISTNKEEKLKIVSESKRVQRVLKAKLTTNQDFLTICNVEKIENQDVVVIKTEAGSFLGENFVPLSCKTNPENRRRRESRE